MKKEIRIGVDFDNTIACYDELMQFIAVNRGYVDHVSGCSKKSLRDSIRSLPDGESKWQKVQAEAYGPKIIDAKLFDGVAQFFARCAELKYQIHIVSHKTEYASADPGGANLREAAIRWMQSNQFFDEAGLGLDRNNVHFESTRLKKVGRIASLGLTHFIDDLKETFNEESFPGGVTKILFSQVDPLASSNGVLTFSSWSEIFGYFKSLAR